MENILLERILRTYRDDLAEKVRGIANITFNALDRIADEIEEFEFENEVKDTEPTGPAREWNVKTWREAAERGVTVSFKYDKPGSTFSDFKTLIVPKSVQEDADLLLGEDKGEIRAYRLDRIKGYVVASQ